MTNKTTQLNVLIVDDEVNIRKTLSYCLVAEGHAVVSVSNASDAVDEARRCAFDLAFVDLKLGADNGMALIPALLSESPWTKVVVITAYASIESAVESIRQGATDYISKPFSPDQVKILTRRIAHIRELETEIVVLREDLQHQGAQEGLQSKSAGMQRVIETARKAAASEATIPNNITPSASIPVIGDRVLLSTIEELHIRRVIANASSLQEAADILGIDQATLWRKRKMYGI